MTKYSTEFKLKAIKMVLKGDSIYHVSKMNCTPKVGQKKQLLEVQFFYD